MEMSRFSPKEFLANYKHSNYYVAVEELNKFVRDEENLDKNKKLDVLLELLRELFQEFSTNKTILSVLLVALTKVSMVIHDIATSCRELLSSTTLPDDLPTALKQLLQLQQMGVATLSDLISSLLSPDNVTVLAAMAMTEIASTVCETLNMSHIIFLVCQEVETFASSSALSSNLMKAIFNFIKVISSLLDVIDLSQLTDETCSVSKVVEHVHMVGKVTLHCEAAITVTTWRTLLKLLCTSKPHLPPDWNIQPIVRDLCEAVRTKLDACLGMAVQLQDTNSQEGKIEFSRSVKMCRFMLNFIMMLCKEFSTSLSCCIPDLYTLILIILSSIPPSLAGVSLDVKGALLQEINISIISVVQLLITKLSSCSHHFICAVTNSDGVGPDRCLAWCVCLLMTCEAFPNITGELQELCMSSKQEDPSSCLLLDAIFDALQRCYVELCYPIWLPLMATNGQQTNRMMSLYDYVTTRLTAMILTLPAEMFHQIELLLLRYLFSDDLYTSLLAVDVWALVSRQMPAELCLHHVTLLTGLLKSQKIYWMKDTYAQFSKKFQNDLFVYILKMMSLPLNCCLVMFNLSSLINNMLNCLPLELQVQYIDCYSPGDTDNLKLWAAVDMENIAPDLHTQLCPVLNKTSLDVINYNLKENQVNMMNMYWAVQSLTKLVTNKYPPSASVIINLWTFTTKLDLSSTENQMIDLFVYDILHLISVATTILPVQELVQILQQLSTLLASNSQRHNVLISSAWILARCGTIVVPDTLKAKFIQSVVSMFHLLLSHTHWMVHHHGAEAFRSFAEVTYYDKDLEQCVPNDLRQIIEDFLNKLPYMTSSNGTLLTKENLCSRLRKRLHSIRNLKQLVAVQREEQRCLQENESSFQCYNRGISLLRQGLEELQKSQQSTALPHTVVNQLTLLNEDLHSFLTAHTSETT